MPLPREHRYTSEDYWNLPEGHRAELIDGQLYDMAPPSFTHQKLISRLSRIIGNFIAEQGGNCEVIPAPFAVNLDAEDKSWVEPDISVICDMNKISETLDRVFPDWIIEIVSPSSVRMDYVKKLNLYMDSGVREYWIVDPSRERTVIYHLESGVAPAIFSFDQDISAAIYDGLIINVADLLK